jgi:hypothetical protein
VGRELFLELGHVLAQYEMGLVENVLHRGLYLGLYRGIAGQHINHGYFHEIPPFVHYM